MFKAFTTAAASSATFGSMISGILQQDWELHQLLLR